jgi:hypothetical protein
VLREIDWFQRTLPNLTAPIHNLLLRISLGGEGRTQADHNTLVNAPVWRALENTLALPQFNHLHLEMYITELGRAFQLDLVEEYMPFYRQKLYI